MAHAQDRHSQSANHVLSVTTLTISYRRPSAAVPSVGARPTQSNRSRRQHQAMDCVFCSIIEGETPSWNVYEDDLSIAFLDIGPATRGHTLVVPRRHSADIWSLSEDEAAFVARSVHRVAAQLRDTLEPLGLTIIQSNGAAAWQDVFHYHVHLVPRYVDDDLAPPWRPTQPSSERLAATQRQIRGR